MKVSLLHILLPSNLETMHTNQWYQLRLSSCCFRCPSKIVKNFNEFSDVIETANACNFEEDYTLTTFSNSIQNLIIFLGSESSLEIKWFKDNKIPLNQPKSEALRMDKIGIT